MRQNSPFPYYLGLTKEEKSAMLAMRVCVEQIVVLKKSVCASDDLCWVEILLLFTQTGEYEFGVCLSAGVSPHHRPSASPPPPWAPTRGNTPVLAPALAPAPAAARSVMVRVGLRHRFSPVVALR